MRSTRTWAIVLVILVCGYGFFVAHRLLEGPAVAITYPEHNSTVTTPLFTLTGTSRNISSIAIGGLPVIHHQDGTFSQDYRTPKGYYEIVAVGTDRFGNTVSDTIRIWGDPPEDTLETPATSTVPTDG
jgi:hypothetical protein